MSQNAVAEQSASFEGMKADAGKDYVLSRAAEVIVPFGKLVIQGTDKDKQCKLPTQASDVTTAALVMGVAVASHAMESKPSLSGAQYAIKDMVNVMHKGVCWVKVEEAVTPADAPVVRHAAGGLGLGSFAKTDDGDHALVANARYLSSAGINGLALLEVDF